MAIKAMTSNPARVTPTIIAVFREELSLLDVDVDVLGGGGGDSEEEPDVFFE